MSTVILWVGMSAGARRKGGGDDGGNGYRAHGRGLWDVFGGVVVVG